MLRAYFDYSVKESPEVCGVDSLKVKGNATYNSIMNSIILFVLSKHSLSKSKIFAIKISNVRVFAA